MLVALCAIPVLAVRLSKSGRETCDRTRKRSAEQLREAITRALQKLAFTGVDTLEGTLEVAKLAGDMYGYVCMYYVCMYSVCRSSKSSTAAPTRRYYLPSMF